MGGKWKCTHRKYNDNHIFWRHHPCITNTIGGCVDVFQTLNDGTEDGFAAIESVTIVLAGNFSSLEVHVLFFAALYAGNEDCPSMKRA